MTGARRYQVKGLLGEGSFGAVYLASAVGTGLARDVAIKILHADRAANPALVGRLRDEARMLALIRHRAIVRVDDLVELDGAWSIVMEYVEGTDAAALLAAGPLPPRSAVAIAEEVANALHAAWQQPGPNGQPLRLVHRDIKPGNIRLTALGEVKLLDFGVARAEFAEREAGTTQTGFGTITYMAPERFEGTDTHAGDVYALGVTLFELLTGVPPGKLAADADRQPPGRRHAEQWAAVASLSRELHGLLARMLAFEAEDRPTARECARALADMAGMLGGERIEDWAPRAVATAATRGPALRSDARTGTLLVERKATAAPPGNGTRALPILAGGVVMFGALVVVTTLGAGGAWWWMHRPAPAPEPPHAEGPLAKALAQPPQPVTPAPETPGVTPASPEKAPTSDVRKTSSKRADPARSASVEAAAVAVPPKAESPKAESPKAEPLTTTGRLEVAGDAVQVVLTGPGGKAAPGAVPAGTFAADVTFPGGNIVHIPSITVAAGRTTTLTCAAAFSNCRASQK